MKKFQPDKFESEILPSKLHFDFNAFLDGSETKFWEPELRGENLGMSYDFQKEYSNSKTLTFDPWKGNKPPESESAMMSLMGPILLAIWSLFGENVPQDS